MLAALQILEDARATGRRTLNYKIPDSTFTVDPNGPIPTITFLSNQSSTHFHVQVQVQGGWQMVIDETGLGKAVPIRGGPINSAADLVGKHLFWDITLATQGETDTVSADLEVEIRQGGNLLADVTDTHNITGQESYFEYMDTN
jgi:hypothetical protein